MSEAPAGWFEVLDTKIVHDGHLQLRIDELSTPDGPSVHREVVTPPNAVAVVAILDDGDVVLVRQHRAPTGQDLLELPAGVLDVAGESVIAAGLRELAEETGLGARATLELTTLWSSPGWSTERVTIVLATGAHPVATPEGFIAHAEEAAMEVVKLPLDVAVTAISEGAITDAKTVVGLLMAAARTA